ncbi:hypothetical protein RhiirA4_407917 [Rhizophagus irregularis]|uniref:Uncharacterized protein n=1 Tax=Rhizophagus irregularis TaxID=588596 RepID=A0A2I1GZC9_9GLOM|nr:hypothetical protein RhiirA4_407917 [Rhizophagus irregularis]
MEILMNTILSNWILMNLGALKEGTCGTLKSWKRAKDQSGNPEIQRILDLRNMLMLIVYCVLCVYLVLVVKVQVKADENTRRYLDQYEGLTVCIKL